LVFSGLKGIISQQIGLFLTTAVRTSKLSGLILFSSTNYFICAFASLELRDRRGQSAGIVSRNRPSLWICAPGQSWTQSKLVYSLQMEIILNCAV
jgi:hypothetical protein